MTYHIALNVGKKLRHFMVMVQQCVMNAVIILAWLSVRMIKVGIFILMGDNIMNDIMNDNLIIDCFAGGGGASVGIEMALGRWKMRKSGI